MMLVSAHTPNAKKNHHATTPKKKARPPPKTSEKVAKKTAKNYQEGRPSKVVHKSADAVSNTADKVADKTADKEVARAAAKVWLLMAAGLAVLFLVVATPIPQNEDYHLFADRRAILGIPYF